MSTLLNIDKFLNIGNQVQYYILHLGLRRIVKLLEIIVSWIFYKNI